MKMTTGLSGRTLTCALSWADTLRFFTELPCDLELDSVGYAACRFLRGSRTMSRDLTEESYRMRMGKGRERRTRRHWCVIPAQLMELPAGWACLRCAVDPAGVTVEAVELYATLEEASAALPRVNSEK